MHELSCRLNATRFASMSAENLPVQYIQWLTISISIREMLFGRPLHTQPTAAQRRIHLANVIHRKPSFSIKIERTTAFEDAAADEEYTE